MPPRVRRRRAPSAANSSRTRQGRPAAARESAAANLASIYFEAMLLDPAGARVAPVDCEAVVRANARLSADYHVLTLDAPDVAARTQPGQFVMVKPGRGLDPLLRRPFSVFEILRDARGRADRRVDPQQDRRHGHRPALRARAPASGSPASARSAARSRRRPPIARSGWSPAASAWRRSRRWPRRCWRAACAPTLFYGARRAGDLHYADWFAERGVDVRARHRGRQRRRARLRHVAARAQALATLRRRRRPVDLRLRPDADDARRRRARRAATATTSRCRSSRRWAAAWAAATAASCRVDPAGTRAAFRPLVPRRPDLPRARALAWEGLAH